MKSWVKRLLIAWAVLGPLVVLVIVLLDLRYRVDKIEQDLTGAHVRGQTLEELLQACLEAIGCTGP